MLVLVAILMVIDLIVLIVWHAAFTPIAVTVVPDPYRISLNYNICESQHTTDPVATAQIFVAVLGAYKGLQIVFGLVLTFLLRKVRFAIVSFSKPLLADLAYLHLGSDRVE